MKGKLYKENDGYSLSVDGKIFGDTDGHPLKAITNKLSLKNCQAIELGYDLDKLARQEAEKLYDKSKHEDYSVWEYLVSGEVDSIKIGFQKCLELMGDKKFSEEDLRLAMHFGKFGEANNQTTTIGFIQSLQQTEWDVTVEMEYIGECNGNNDEGCFQDSPGHNCGCFERRPKLDADGCLILKHIK